MFEHQNVNEIQQTLINQLLSLFYKDVCYSIKNNNEKWFISTCGLCNNIRSWCQHHSIEDKEEKIYEKMLDQFREANLDLDFPFNAGCQDEYTNESITKTIYKNPARLQWIKDHCDDKHLTSQI